VRSWAWCVSNGRKVVARFYQPNDEKSCAKARKQGVGRKNQ
jgi:hypothetical protein